MAFTGETVAIGDSVSGKRRRRSLRKPGPLSRSYVNEVLPAAHSFGKRHAGYLEKACSQKEKHVNLSKQQTHMLKLLSLGCRNSEISEMTELSIPTIKSHTSLAYRKLGVNNAMDAVLKARELGLIGQKDSDGEGMADDVNHAFEYR